MSVLATVIVALAFAPVREWARRLANRLVYGETASPYDVLADLGHRLAGALPPDDLLPSLARSAATGVGASAAEVRLILPDGTDRTVAWPDGCDVDGESVVVVPVTRGSDVFGHIAIAPRPGAALTRAQRGLITDLARQAAAPLSNVRLTIQLEDQLDQISRQAADLRASRERLVRAQDDERRRIERDIHDGAQQQLVAVTLGLLAARQRAPDPLATELDEIRHDVADILVDAARPGPRDLPAVARRGRPRSDVARPHRQDAPPRVELDDRLPAGLRAGSDVEAAVYFCCLEALQNVSKHAPDATLATVRLELVDGDLVFDVIDDGAGFDLDASTRAAGPVCRAWRIVSPRSTAAWTCDRSDAVEHGCTASRRCAVVRAPQPTRDCSCADPHGRTLEPVIAVRHRGDVGASAPLHDERTRQCHSARSARSAAYVRVPATPSW